MRENCVREAAFILAGRKSICVREEKHWGGSIYVEDTRWHFDRGCELSPLNQAEDVASLWPEANSPGRVLEPPTDVDPMMANCTLQRFLAYRKSCFCCSSSTWVPLYRYQSTAKALMPWLEAASISCSAQAGSA